MSHQDPKEADENNFWQTVKPPEGWDVGAQGPFTSLDEWVNQTIDKAIENKRLILALSIKQRLVRKISSVLLFVIGINLFIFLKSDVNSSTDLINVIRYFEPFYAGFTGAFVFQSFR